MEVLMKTIITGDAFIILNLVSADLFGFLKNIFSCSKFLNNPIS